MAEYSHVQLLAVHTAPSSGALFTGIREMQVSIRVFILDRCRRVICTDFVNQMLRQLFNKIALPFSPHKSGNIRGAELEDILKACVVDKGHGLIGHSESLTQPVTHDSRSSSAYSMQGSGNGSGFHFSFNHRLTPC